MEDWTHGMYEHVHGHEVSQRRFISFVSVPRVGEDGDMMIPEGQEQLVSFYFIFSTW